MHPRSENSKSIADGPKDEIHFPAPKPPVTNIIGGAGAYSALGARLFSPPPQSSKVGWVVHTGSDFPHELREIISSWSTSCALLETPNRLITRALNEYGDDEFRGLSKPRPSAIGGMLLTCDCSRVQISDSQTTP